MAGPRGAFEHLIHAASSGVGHTALDVAIGVGTKTTKYLPSYAADRRGSSATLAPSPWATLTTRADPWPIENNPPIAGEVRQWFA